jgi:hypothetical protein
MQNVVVTPAVRPLPYVELQFAVLAHSDACFRPPLPARLVDTHTCLAAGMGMRGAKCLFFRQFWHAIGTGKPLLHTVCPSVLGDPIPPAKTLTAEAC